MNNWITEFNAIRKFNNSKCQIIDQARMHINIIQIEEAQKLIDNNYSPEGSTDDRKELIFYSMINKKKINNYGKKRNEITNLDISHQNLIGDLDLSDFISL